MTMDSQFPNSHPALPRRRARLLMIAYTCRPGRGSEGGIGWNRALQAGRFVDVWVVCEGRECESEIRGYIREHGPPPGVTFVFVPFSNLQARLIKLPGFYYLTYYLWHRAAFAAARELHARHHFDFAHQATMTGWREPGLLWRLPIPLVWGPVGGTQNFPWRFLTILSFRDAAVEIARNLINSFQLRTSLRVRRAARTAYQTIAANRTNRHDMERLCGVPLETMLDVGINEVGEPSHHETPVKSRLRILWTGLIEPRKALPLLIEACAKLRPEIDWEVQVLGDGPLGRQCRNRTRALGIDGRFTWLGWKERSEALSRYAWADVLAFTSLRDTTGTVVLEALSHGVPVVCLDHQGAGDIITPECGVKIPVSSPSKVIDDLAATLECLADDPLRRTKLREGARQRACIYLWPRLGEQMADCYRRVLRSAGMDADVRECLPAPESKLTSKALVWNASSETESESSLV
jgi:glycosyltransferase involved in cell wall biosynthesis